MLGGCPQACVTRYVVSEPAPCTTPAVPTPPDVNPYECLQQIPDSEPQTAVCLTLEDTAELEEYLRLLKQWVEMAQTCPGVQPESGNSPTTGVREQ